ncbi:platelet-activating factor acetylhydrolase, isoform II-domain-containing protein [Lipomyces oligophaga]|uniref:platelet-activating factor acetylhydrolase, isoform II-domain-containing protein n=1 Tax=Lipomyces oligophaga TaxID=45792 RepID=UPI0034CF2B1E
MFSPREYFTPRLPPYPGPFPVGTVEIEIPAPWPKAYPEIQSSVETLLFRLFYPVSADVFEACEAQHPFWFPEDRREYLRALVDFTNRPAIAGNLISRIPYITDTVLPCKANLPLKAAPEGQKWPVVLFSHGLGGTRNTYSQFCGSMASHGFIVIAPEHREHSAPLTHVRDFSAKGWVQKRVHYRREMEINQDARILRTYQLVQRSREIVSILRVLLVQQPELLPIDRAAVEAGRQIDPIKFDWSQVNTKLDEVILSGHSFGASTVVSLAKGAYHHVEMLFETKDSVPISNVLGFERVPSNLETPIIDREDEFLRPVSTPALLLLDPWGIPVYHTMSIPLTVPTLANMSQPFYNWGANMKLIYQLLSNSAVEESAKPVPPIKTHLFLTQPSAHASQSDLTLLFPTLSRVLFKIPGCSAENQTAVMDMNVTSCVEFLREQGISSYDVTAEGAEGLMKAETSEHPVHEPNDKLTKGYLVADGKIQGWSRLDVKDGISVVNILE